MHDMYNVFPKEILKKIPFVSRLTHYSFKEIMKLKIYSNGSIEQVCSTIVRVMQVKY
jgi:hypothetical protein